MKRTLLAATGATLVACGSPATAPVVEPPASASAPASTPASASASASASPPRQVGLGALGGSRIDTDNGPPVDLAPARVSTPPGTKTSVIDAKGDVAVASVTTSVPVANASTVVASLRPRFRQCYQVGRNTDPTMTGKLVISAQIDAAGDVVSSTVVSNAGLSVGVATCVANVVKRASFSPPAGSGATLTFATTHVIQK